jgi:ATP/maltotriose-dependent transcriptional regulator MalT
MRTMTKNLARREREVVTLICEEGLSNKEAAWRLGITYLSAKTHLGSAYQKLGITGGDREMIVRYWKFKEASESTLSAA